jgi:hypothetical protein
MTAPIANWRMAATPQPYEEETWYARYRGWTLYAGLICGHWRVAAHRFVGGSADQEFCKQRYPTLEGAQNAAEFFAEHERWPHAIRAEAPR